MFDIWVYVCVVAWIFGVDCWLELWWVELEV